MTIAQKITAFTELTEPVAEDVLAIVDDPDGAGKKTKKVTVSNLNRNFIRTAAEIAAGVTPTDFTYEPGSALRYGAVGDGSDETTVLQTWADCGEADLVLPYGSTGVYVTKGILIGTNSGVGRVQGLGMPELKRQGAISGSDNDTILTIYKNILKIDGIKFNGDGTNLAPADPTLYTELALNSTVGSGDNLAAQSNLTTVSNCYFSDSAGSCIAGAGMQSTIIQGCKFDGWLDHAVYNSGGVGGGLGLGESCIVDANIFYHTGSVSNGAVKFGGNVRRVVVSNNTINIGDERFVDLHGRTVFTPLDVVVSDNVGSCGIFANILSDTSSPQDVDAHFEFANNNMRCSVRAFRLGEASGQDFLGHLNIVGGSYENTSGVFVGFLQQTANIDNANSVTEINLKGVKTQHYGVLDGPYPKRLTLSGCTFDQTYAAWILSTNTDDASVKTVIIEGCQFLDPAASGGRTDINVNDDSSVFIRNNLFRGSALLTGFVLRDLPKLLIYEGNTCIDAPGITAVTGITARASPDGVMLLAENRMISTVGASILPRLLSEGAASGDTLLDSYNIITHHNYFFDVTGGINCTGAQVTGFGGSQIIYAVDNYGLGTNTMNCLYPVANRSSFLPQLPIVTDYTITNDVTDRTFDANAAAGAITSPPTQAEVENIRDAMLEVSDVLATQLKDTGKG